jgi:hypothetical protein
MEPRACHTSSVAVLLQLDAETVFGSLLSERNVTMEVLMEILPILVDALPAASVCLADQMVLDIAFLLLARRRHPLTVLPVRQLPMPIQQSQQLPLFSAPRKSIYWL